MLTSFIYLIRFGFGIMPSGYCPDSYHIKPYFDISLVFVVWSAHSKDQM